MNNKAWNLLSRVEKGCAELAKVGVIPYELVHAIQTDGNLPYFLVLQGLIQHQSIPETQDVLQGLLAVFWELCLPLGLLSLFGLLIWWAKWSFPVLLEILDEHILVEDGRCSEIDLLIIEPGLARNDVDEPTLPVIESLLLVFVLHNLRANLHGVPLGEEVVGVAEVKREADRVLEMPQIVVVSWAHVKDQDFPLQVLLLIDYMLGINQL